MSLKSQKYIYRLIRRIAHKEQSINDSFYYYGHFVNLQSGTPDYVDVTIYQTNDPYQGELASFSFDFWTKELYFSNPVSDRLADLILDAFKQLYRGAKVVGDENEEYPEEKGGVGE